MHKDTADHTTYHMESPGKFRLVYGNKGRKT
jgi:hypothetical protein